MNNEQHFQWTNHLLMLREMFPDSQATPTNQFISFDMGMNPLK